MGIRDPRELTRNLEAMGIPNPFEELRLTKADNFHLFARTYLGNMTVSDMVTAPHGHDLYTQCAEGDPATNLMFDELGKGIHRLRPREGFVYAVVQSPTYSLFWQRLENAIDLKLENDYLIFSDEFVATYGAPEGSAEIPPSSPLR